MMHIQINIQLMEEVLLSGAVISSVVLGDFKKDTPTPKDAF